MRDMQKYQFEETESTQNNEIKGYYYTNIL